MPDDIHEIIRKLQNYELRVIDVPEEFESNMEIIRAERKLGLRLSNEKGFDVLSQNFFVNEELRYKAGQNDARSFLSEPVGDGMVCRHNKTYFLTFEELFNFLDGNVYTDACYQYYDFGLEEKFINENHIDLAKIKKCHSYTTQTVDDFFSADFSDEIQKFNNVEKVKVQILKWLEKFSNCCSYDDFSRKASNYMKSTLSKKIGIDFFIENLIVNEKFKDRIELIIAYIFSRKYTSANKLYFSLPDTILCLLCSVYGADYIVDIYNDLLLKGQIYNNQCRVSISKFEAGNITACSHSFFDSTTHFYCDEIKASDSISYKRWFETFDEFVIYKKFDLRGCDLSKALNLKFDFSRCDVDENTKLPPRNGDDLIYSIFKKYKWSSFYVTQFLRDSRGALIRESVFSSKYFSDFVYFLKSDLSNADLLYCEGLENLPKDCKIIFDGASMRSYVCDTLGVNYEPYIINEEFTQTFALPEKNEKEYALTVNTSSAPLEKFTKEAQRIFYITDIHLIHRLKDSRCKSKSDIIYMVQEITKTIAQETGQLLLIGGDISADFWVFSLFIDALKKNIEVYCRRKCTVVFILGNHELWSFPGKTVEKIKSIYKEYVESRGMFLLQNDILYKGTNNEFNIIEYNDLKKIGQKQLQEQLRCARLVILGGIGFSGYNKEFNANHNVYQRTLDRKTEISETQKFEKLYKKLLPIIESKNTIIFTHMPLNDWCAEKEPQRDFVYISGHTHKDFFYDDGCYRIYADNQIGYSKREPHLKALLIGDLYDYFSDYEDGIHEISREQYMDFYRGKNMPMTFSQKFKRLYMLKKYGYYCFIKQDSRKHLAVMNGGRKKNLLKNDINYYYENMDKMIAYIKNPLDKFTAIQDQIANEIKKIGGSGRIHGCIVDIDFFNHIYVNPDDLTITGYWARDMVYKMVYRDVPSLLKVECPALYGNYLKLIGDSGEKELTLIKSRHDLTEVSKPYFDTDIYKKSNEIYKMQKLNSNLLCTWYEGEPLTPEIPEKSSK